MVQAVRRNPDGKSGAAALRSSLGHGREEEPAVHETGAHLCYVICSCFDGCGACMMFLLRLSSFCGRFFVCSFLEFASCPSQPAKLPTAREGRVSSLVTRVRHDR